MNIEFLAISQRVVSIERVGTATEDGAVRELGKEPPLERIKQETDSNYQTFLRLRETFTRHEGEYALMKAGLILDFFPTSQAAMLAGHERCLDQVFSIHRVRARQEAEPTIDAGLRPVASDTT